MERQLTEGKTRDAKKGNRENLPNTKPVGPPPMNELPHIEAIKTLLVKPGDALVVKVNLTEVPDSHWIKMLASVQEGFKKAIPEIKTIAVPNGEFEFTVVRKEDL